MIDRHHNLLAGNDALTTLTAGVAPELLEAPANALRVALHPEGMARRTVNLAEWSAHVLQRLRREVRMTADPQLQALYDELKGYPGVEHDPPGDAPASSEIVVPLRLRDQDGSELAFFGTITTFGTPADITLAEVAVEAFYPANPAPPCACSTRSARSWRRAPRQTRNETWTHLPRGPAPGIRLRPAWSSAADA